MDNLGTWLAIGAVGIGFMILVWLLFSEPTKDRKTPKKPGRET